MKTLATVAALAAALASAAPIQAQLRANRPEIVPLAGWVIFDDLLRGPLGTTLSNSNGGMFGAQVGVPLAGPISLFAGGAYARSDLTIGVPILGGLTVGNTDAWMFDGGLQLRAPTSGNIAPLVQLGGGVIHYRISNALINTESTNAAATVGAGVDVSFTPSVGLRLMAKDYIGKFDFKEAVFVDIEGRTSHNIGLVAGLRIAM